MGAKKRNEAAREIATENPGRVADHAMGSEWLRAALNAWPLPDLGGEMGHPDPEEAHRKTAAATAERSPEWRALVCGYLLLRRQMMQRKVVIHTRGLPPLLDGMEVYDQAENATVVCEHLACLPDPNGPDALALLTRVVEAIPRPGRANINRTDRILPARLAMVDHTDRRAGRLFTPAAHAVERGGEQLKLPGFGLERTRITPALPLALYDLGGGSSMERGHGAPLPLRLWVESILAVGLTDRANPWPTVLEIPLRDLLRKLYPGKRRPRPNEYWPRLMQAVEILDSTRIPWEDPKTGKGGLRRIVNVSDIPRGPGKLDDAVQIIVTLPPGSGKGPVVSPNLNRYGVQSAPLYRGLLNLAYLWFDPGRTRFPVRGGKHWLQVEDPERYPTITNDLLIELFYPTSAQRERKVLANRARQDLDRLVKDGEAQIVKGRLMPPAPREGR